MNNSKRVLIISLTLIRVTLNGGEQATNYKLFCYLFTKYNLVNNALPPYFNNFCIINAELHNYHTRSSRKLHKTFNRTNYSVYSTRNKVINTWNNIPAPIKQSNSVFIFNKNMKKFLISGA